MILAFDTETDGLGDAPNLVELGAVLLDEGGTERAVASLIVTPDDFSIPPEAAAVHGITDELARVAGVPLVVAVAVLTNLWARARVRVAHNLEFDDRVIDAALRRLGRASALPRPPGACTAALAAPILNLPPTERMIAAGYGDRPKTPSLTEVYRHLFGGAPPGTHSALADARAAGRIFLAIEKGKHDRS